MIARMGLPGWPVPTWRGEIYAAGLLTLGTLIAFCQVVRFDFVNFDDPVYVYNNLDVQQGLYSFSTGLNLDTIEWAFRETRKSAHWHPLTWLSLALDWNLYAHHAGGFHLTNLALHLANTLLLFWVLRLSTGSVWRSAAVAGFFGWHPLHVESVAWITERKDVLSTFFWMLTMLAYVTYAKRSSELGREGVWKWYLLTILFFVMGLLSKPMVVTLPCVLLLWDYWPLKRVALSDASSVLPGAVSGRPWFGPAKSWKRLLLEKAPFFGLALASGLWTAMVMRAGTVRRTGLNVSLEARVQNALLSAVALLRKMVWPSDLAPLYPAPLSGEDYTIEAILAGVLLVFCTGLAYAARHRYPYLLVGWLWYMGTLLLVSVRWQAGSFSWADRYTYVPMIGIFIALVWAACDWLQRWRPLLIAAFTTLLLGCLALTWQQVKIWENSETLWTHTLKVTDADKNFLAHYDLGLYLQENNRLEEALPHLQKAVDILPKAAELRAGLERAQRALAVRSQNQNQSIK